MKTFFEKLAVFLAGAILLAVCLEISLRVLGSRYVAELPHIKKHTAYTVLCVGDSFTQGAGAPAQKDYPRQLEEVLQERFPGRAFKAVNFGESAQNTTQLLQRLPRALDETHPDAVVLLSGMANFWNYWGYHDGTTPPRRDILDRVRIAQLVKLLWRETSHRLPGRTGQENNPDQTHHPETPGNALCMKEMREAKDVEGILTSCKESVRLDPQDFNALANIGFAYLNSNRPDEALEWLGKALKVDPTDIIVYVGITTALERNRGESEKWRKIAAIRTGGGTEALFSRNLNIPAWIRLDLNEAVDLVTSRGIKMILQNYPGNERNEPLLTSSLLRETAAARSLPFVDQASVFSRLVAKGLRDEYFSPRDPHCSARGYRLMAEQVADAMEKNSFIKRAVKP